MTRSTRSTIGVIVAVVLGVSACTSTTSDRAGGRGLDEPMVLEIAQPNDEAPPQVQAYAAEVRNLSHGTLQLHFKDFWRKGDAEYERQTLQDVVTGKVAGAWVGVRSLDLLGITSFQPLEAPMLVDSQALQGRIFSDGIQLEMAHGVDGHGLVAAAILPGPMRKVLGLHKPFLEPADFEGAVLGIQDGLVMEDTAQALGAAFRRMPSGAKLAGVDAYEQQIDTIFGNRYGAEAKYVTANLNLWPRAMAIVVNDATYRRLTDEQRQTLLTAAVNAVPAALEASRTEDGEDVDKLCGQDVAFPTATDQQLAHLREAVQPVHDKIASDAGNAGVLRRIADLKTLVAARPDVAVCTPPSHDVTASPQTGVGGLPEGTYEAVHTPEDLRRCDGQPSGIYLNPDGHPQTSYDSLTLDHGALRLSARLGSRSALSQIEWVGTYRVFRNVFELTESSTGHVDRATFTFDGRTLSLAPVGVWQCDGLVTWTLHPWTLAKKAP